MQKTEGKDLPNVKQLPMQETSSSGILTQGANKKTCGGDGSTINKIQFTLGF
jgi:hypothetical protein